MVLKQWTQPAVRRRYDLLAPVYDWANLEPLLYAEARARMIDMLRLQPGAMVLDVACGTGVNFELIEQRIGPSGRLVGFDFTPRMLDRARARVDRRGWRNVGLHQGDVTELASNPLDALGVLASGEQFDAALCTLGLSVIPRWEAAWEAMLSLVRPGGTVAVMDAGYPPRASRTSWPTAAARPFAWLLSRIFAADCGRRPWELVQRDTNNAITEGFTWGYVVAAAGEVRAARGDEPEADR